MKEECPFFKIDDKDKFRAIHMWGVYESVLKAKRLAVKIDGPFYVEPMDWGPATYCEDGYLCLTSDGLPYAVNKAAFERCNQKVASIAGRCLFVDPTITHIKEIETHGA